MTAATTSECIVYSSPVDGTLRGFQRAKVDGDAAWKELTASVMRLAPLPKVQIWMFASKAEADGFGEVEWRD